MRDFVLMGQRWTWLFALLLGVAGGVLFSREWVGSSESHPRGEPIEVSPTSRPEAQPAANGVTRLLHKLERERAERRALELDVQVLRDRLARLEDSLFEERTDGSSGQASHRIGTVHHFDSTKLLEQGFRETRITDIEQRYEHNRLEILKLRDRATREAWVGSPRFDDEVTEREQGLRNQLGPNDYDVLLYATGQPNRVILQKVLAGSSAAEAGLEPGDVVVRYASSEIFDPRDLRAATSGGRAGEMVEITVIRAQRRQRLQIARGPLGATVRRMSHAPDSE